MVNLLAPAGAFQKNRFLEAFEANSKHLKQDPNWLNRIRQLAISRFTSVGFPTMQDEEWRYTNIAALQGIPFDIPSNSATLLKNEIDQFRFEATHWPSFIFVDGQFVQSLSSASINNKGWYIGSIKDALQINFPDIEKHLGQYADFTESSFTALNSAFIQDGALVYFPDEAILSEPIHLIFIATGHEPNTLLQPRNLIVAGKRSRALIVESYVSISDIPYLRNAVTEIFLDEAASVEYYKIQREAPQAYHISTTQVQLERASHFNSVSVSLGSRLARQNLNVRMNDEQANCELSGLFLGSDDQHIDYHTFVDHPKPKGSSAQLYKGILSKNSSGVFSGKIFVGQDAQQTNAHQSNKNLLLSDKATVDTKPQLEILADDVKCTHGAAVGQLDEEAIFYFKTRGIGFETARKLLCYGFAKEVIDKINIVEISDELNRLVHDRFADPLFWEK